MALASLFTLLDDIASVLDDVALMTKMAAKKTAGVVGDDLALNANQVTGVQAERELPIVWAVAKGSLINKIILIPVALILAIFAPILIKPLLMIGGAYLCFEGVEKLWHKFTHHHENHENHEQNQDNFSEKLEKLENLDESSKIKGAIRTDFILSAEIIIIALGEIQQSSVMVKILALSAVGVGMTVAVYGLVGLIVKADDFGAFLLNTGKELNQKIGKLILLLMPMFMRALAVIGTVAMFLVGGGIFTHNIDLIHELLHAWHWDSGILSMLVDFVIGLLVGAIACVIVLPIMNQLEKIK